MQRQRSVVSWLALALALVAPQPRLLQTGARARRSLLSALVLLTSGLLLDCGNDEALSNRPTTPIEADGGDGSGVSGAGTLAGSSAAGESSSGGNTSQAGEGPTLGGAAGGGSTQAGAPAMAGAGGADDTPTTEQLSFGARIPAPQQNAIDVARAYNKATFGDCRTKWVTNLFLDKDEQALFLNNLVTWNIGFWGCLNQPPVSGFALIHGEAPLSAGDAALLIEHYIAVATVELTLSPLEITEMRAALERLAAPLIADPSTEPSQPDCADGGAGGAGGAPGGAGAGPVDSAGQGGAP